MDETATEGWPQCGKQPWSRYCGRHYGKLRTSSLHARAAFISRLKPDRHSTDRILTLYLLILMAFLTHIGFAGSRLAVPLFAVDQGGGPFVVGTIVALYAALPAVL